MDGRDKVPGDVATKIAVAWSYSRVADPLTSAFLIARLLALPLERFHHALPAEGTIIDVGCGHGAVAQYLARRAPARKVIGYDPDTRRVSIARRAARLEGNLEYRVASVEPGFADDVTAVLVLGVLCLVDDVTCRRILTAARLALRDGGKLVLSDILKNERDWRYSFHLWRERWFARVGFTRSEGLFVRPAHVWQTMIRDAGFQRAEPFAAPVMMHSVFNWICS